MSVERKDCKPTRKALNSGTQCKDAGVPLSDSESQLHEALFREQPSWSALFPWLRVFWFSDLTGAWWCLLLQVERCVYLPHLLTSKGHPVLYKLSHLSSACSLPMLTSICLGHSLSSLVTFWSSQRAVFQEDNSMVAQENWRRMDGLKKPLGRENEWYPAREWAGKEGKDWLSHRVQSEGTTA